MTKILFSFLVATLLLNLVWGRVRDLDYCPQESTSRCFDESCGIPIYDAHSGIPCYCVDEDIGRKFTACDPISQTKDLVYFWKPPATCIGNTLPLPVYGFPCDFSCPAGTAVDIATQTCKECNPGTFSIGGAQRWGEWHELPAQFRTYCVSGDFSAEGGCSAWQIHGESIDSGNNYDYHYLTSTLELRANLVQNGSIKFSYKISSEEGADRFWFLVDNVVFEYTSNADWTILSFDIPAGYHTFEWIYDKDYSISKGEDRVTIGTIILKGTDYTAYVCEQCPPGHYADSSNATYCVECPPNSYSEHYGSPNCTACPNWAYSPSGSSVCYPKTVCDPDVDFTYSYGPCENGTREKIYSYVQPTACDIYSEPFLPNNTFVDCESLPTSCLPGQRISPHSETGCEYCASGEAGSGDSTTCETCLAGSAGNSRIHYFDTWPVTGWPEGTGVFGSSCTGNCGTDGWRRGEHWIDSGFGNGGGSMNTLTYTAQMYSGYITYNFSLSCVPGNRLMFFVNDNIWNTYECTGCDGSPLRVAFPFIREHSFSSQLTFFKWSYVKDHTDNVTSSCDRAIIYNINVAGLDEGEAGSSVCQPCSPGFFSADSLSDHCSPCPAGFSSDFGASECLPCSNTTFQPDEGGQCLPCGDGTIGEIGGVECTYNCSPNNTDLQWNIQELGTFTFYSNIGYIAGTFCDSVDTRCPQSKTCLIQTEGDELVYNFGRAINFTPFENNKGLQVDYLYGEVVIGEREDSVCNLRINLICDTKANIPSPTLTEIDIGDDCHAIVNWPTPYGCPLCTENDFAAYEQTDAECTSEGTKQSIYYKTNQYCHGGYVSPGLKTTKCVNSSSVSNATLGVIIGLGITTVVASLGGLFYFYKKHQRLYATYQTLVTTNVPMEEPQFTVSDN